MNIAEEKITAHSVTTDDNVTLDLENLSSLSDGLSVDNVVVVTGTFDETQKAQLDKLFNWNNLLVSLETVYDGNRMGLTSRVQSAEQFIIANMNTGQFRNNQIQIAGLLDGYEKIEEVLRGLNTVAELEGLVNNLLAPELAANAQTLPLNHPYFRVFNHINNLSLNYGNDYYGKINSRSNSNSLIRGQSCSAINCNVAKTSREFWFEGYYQGGKIDNDSNALGYKTSRAGMMVGVDQYLGNNLLTGLIFGYGNPRAYNSIGRIEADDYTFGAYSRLKISNIYANLFLGYGKQSYLLRQNQTNTGYNGDSMYASLEVFRPILLNNNLSVAPLIALDFQKAWSDGFNVNVANIPLAIKKGDIDQTVLRIGINSNYKNLRTRLQYGYQVAGDCYGIAQTSITGGNRILSGVHLGRHTLNVGLGGDFSINNRTKLFVDYDFDLGEHANTHSGQFGFVRNF
ncbi:MAG: autotransporter outer membrane beta-barrel domain-containing protein [Planctomycetaceae bacterium]|nr:autotransporter outer membrane beta-barrel domain-containing protein [Planctomycetaceae bacterium]